MTTLSILLIRTLSLTALFLLTLLLITQETVKRCQRWLKLQSKSQADPLANLKKAKLTI